MTWISFPEDFLWGTATASYQIEGAVKEGGKGESIWDRFAHTPGKIRDGSTGDRACDHYHLYREDVALMKELKHKAYRFSISWPRILPEGRGRVNREGLDFYSRLVDALLDAEIEPMVTLYHWDLPQVLEDRGGWAARDITGWFGDYAFTVAGYLGDRVKLWTTLNEPQMFSLLGYMIGVHAPGVTDLQKYFPVSHHINLAHGQGVQAIRNESPTAQVGTVLQCPPIHPVTESEEDHRAARVMDGLLNRWYAEPVLLGRYPEDMLDLLESYNLPFEEGDLDRIHQPLDFVGLNVYTRLFARHDPSVSLLEATLAVDHKISGAEYTAMGWEVYPRAIYESLLRFKEEWSDPAVFITENGAAYDDRLVDQTVEDKQRLQYFQKYLAQVRRAIDQGVKVKGYFAWSLLDNFEWAEGYTKRFGLVHVDFNTLKRTPKTSAFWYREVIASSGFELPD
ncbi:MAG: beta-glucosidase [Deltaproteobacteria bacterium]|nr:beta-glucosidase [Deltaproteobacteria bacterium]MBW2084475.1 beta-glucosidase [Deltaproteobacteria bacterium]